MIGNVLFRLLHILVAFNHVAFSSDSDKAQQKIVRHVGVTCSQFSKFVFQTFTAEDNKYQMNTLHKYHQQLSNRHACPFEHTTFQRKSKTQTGL